MNYYNARRTRRKAKITSPDLFDWAQTQRLVADPAIAHITRRDRVTPSTAALLAELAGIGNERAS